MNDDTLTGSQRYALRQLLDGSKDEARLLWLLTALVGHAVENLDDVTRREWATIRDAAYPRWPEQDWTISDDFRRKLAALDAQWREEIHGQQRLF